MRGRLQAQEIQFFERQCDKELDAVMNLLGDFKKGMPHVRCVPVNLGGVARTPVRNDRLPRPVGSLLSRRRRKA